MTIDTYTLSVTAIDASGNVLPDARVVATLDKADLTSDGVLLPSRIEAQADGDGLAELDLASNLDGTQNSRYRIEIFRQTGKLSNIFDRVQMPRANTTLQQIIESPEQVVSLSGAAISADLAEAWAEGTEPGGEGTKSAREWALESSTPQLRDDLSDSFADGKGAALVGDAVASVNTIDDLRNVDSSELQGNRAVNVLGYHEPGDGGGGLWQLDEGRDRSTANGVTILDPTKPLNEQGTGEGEGCWVRLSGALTVSVTITVGSGGAFQTLSDALRHLQGMQPAATQSGEITAPEVEILLLSGFVLSEQVVFDGVNLSWVRISSEDATVTVDRQALTEALPAGSNRFPAILVINGAVAPLLGVRFQMNETGTGTNRYGIRLWEGATLIVLPGAGFENAPLRNIEVSRRSELVAGYSNESTYWSNLGAGTSIGARVSNGSTAFLLNAVINNCAANNIAVGNASIVHASGADLSGCGQDAFDLQGSALGTCEGANCDDAGRHAVRARDGSVINASGVSAQRAGSTGLFAESGSTIVAEDANVNDSFNGARALDASKISAAGLLANDCSSVALIAEGGSEVSANSASLTGAGVNAIRTLSGGEVVAENADLSGAAGPAEVIRAWGGGFVNVAGANVTERLSTRGLDVRDGSTANAVNADFRVAGSVASTDVRIGLLGGVVHATGAEYDSNRVRNTIVGGGVIYDAGYVHSASGTAQVNELSTSVDVTHGLSFTPNISDISVTPTNDLGDAAQFWVSDPTSTQFTINVNVDPGSTGATFAWSVSRAL